MIKVVVGNNVKREQSIVDSGATLRSVLEGAGVEYAGKPVTLDGSTLGPGDLDRTFESFHIQEKTYLLVVTKADNA